MFLDKSHAKKIAGIPALGERAGPPGETPGRLGEKVKTAKTGRFAYNLKC
jgi:hypothetical protein